MSQQPSVGRIVHYTSKGWAATESEPLHNTGKAYAAIITAVHNHGEGQLPCVDLTIFYPKGVGEDFLTRDEVELGYPYSETPKPGHWNWPPRV